MSIGQFFFKTRSFTPVPMVIAILAIPFSFSLWAPDTGSVWQVAAVIAAGLLISVFGESIRFVSLAYSSGNTRTREVGASKLFCKGPYAHVRNPLYIGNFFITLGMIVMSWTWFPWLPLIGIVLFIIQYYFIIRLEEDTLIEVLGDEYVEYRKNVPRIIPQLKAYKGGREYEPDYSKSIKSEKNSIRAEIIMIILIGIRWYLILK